MIGDVNLFLYPYDDDDEKTPTEYCVAEVDIMIASPSHRGKGLGRAVVSTLLRYVSINLDGILEEYYAGEKEAQGQSCEYKTVPKLKMLMAKINEGNANSIALFKSLGFEQEGEVNYFGEVKLVLKDLERAVKDGQTKGWTEGYVEAGYERAGGEEGR